MYYIVKYSGPFGFIKPWTAVRDGATFSQQFLTPSILAGIERKLFPELLKEDFGIFKVKRYRLSYQQISQQQEQIQPRGWNYKNKIYERPYSVLIRGVMVNPILFLAFESKEDAKVAAAQHICLARNEDILYPENDIIEINETDFDEDVEHFHGFELMFEKNEHSFLVGYNRLDNNKPMYGWLNIIGNPVNNEFK